MSDGKAPPGFPIEKMLLPDECLECGGRVESSSAYGRVSVGAVPDIGIITITEAQKKYCVAEPKIGDEVFWASVDGHCTVCSWRAGTMAARIAPVESA